MRLRNQPLGSKNLIGARVESARKEQGMKQKELLAQPVSYTHLTLPTT